MTEAASNFPAIYVLANLSVRDADQYRIYEKGFFPLLKRDAGEFVTYDDKREAFEGSSPRSGRIVILKFPSEGHARRLYADPDYLALSAHRRAGADLHFLTMVLGPPPRV